MNDENSDAMPVVELSENGPYIVKNLTMLNNSKGEDIPAKAVIALCRCGASGNKPFCDGAHNKIGFQSKNEADASKDKRDTYVGSKITIHDNRALCAHAGICTDGLPSVWRMKHEPWIDPDGAGVDAIIDIVNRCPSGALSYSIDGVEKGVAPARPTVTVLKDGPYHVAGGIGLDVSRNEGASKESYALCRCGASKNKPFCDGTHWSVNFTDDAN